jgi:hypothetical protein
MFISLLSYSIILLLAITLLVLASIFNTFFTYKVTARIGIITIIAFGLITLYLLTDASFLIIYSFYAALIFTLATIFEDYLLGLMIVGTLLLITNPLDFLRKKIFKKLNIKNNVPLNINLYRSRWAIFEYRKLMKQYFHMPDTIRLFNSKTYKVLRQLTFLAILFLAILIFIYQMGRIVLQNFTLPFLAFRVFLSTMLFLIAFILFKKGFLSTLRLLSVLIFPVLLFLILVVPSDLINDISRLILFSFMVICTLASFTYNLFLYFQRVLYNYYYYFDNDSKTEVYANSLFEPLVYNYCYTYFTKYSIKISREAFLKHFNELVVYANFKLFFIISYSFSNDCCYIFTATHYKEKYKINNFKKILDRKYNTNCGVYTVEDKDAKVFENMFFHKDEYIMSRAVSEAALYKSFTYKHKIIVSIVFYFTNYEKMNEYSISRNVMRLKEYEYSGNAVVKTSIIVENDDILIKKCVKNMLLDASLYDGHYVRIIVLQKIVDN